jgi:hypothetical protein
MSDYTVTLTIPETVYTRAQEMAEHTAQPVEEVLLSSLVEVFDDANRLPPDEQAELEALAHLSDDTLWTIAAERMPAAQQERLSLLLALNKRGVLSEAEDAELDNLLERGDRLTLRKAEAAVILTRRGYQVDLSH